MKLTNEIELVQESNEVLIKSGQKSIRIKLENELMQMLLLLAEYQGKPVSKRLFIEKIWNRNELTGDLALTRNIDRLSQLFRNQNLEDMIKKRLAVLFAGLVLTVLTFGYLLYNRDYEETPIRDMVVGKDTIIQSGPGKITVSDPDTLKFPVVLNGFHN